MSHHHPKNNNNQELRKEGQYKGKNFMLVDDNFNLQCAVYILLQDDLQVQQQNKSTLTRSVIADSKAVKT